MIQECQNRPFKCHLCNVGFRISGHLSRHYKSRAHINQMQKLPDSTMVSVRNYNFGTMNFGTVQYVYIGFVRVFYRDAESRCDPSYR